MGKSYNPQFERIGAIFVKEGMVSQEQLEEGLRLQHREIGKKIGQVLIDLAYLDEDDLVKSLGLQTGYATLTENDLITIDTELLKQVSESFAKEHHLIPYRRKGNIVRIAMSDPEDLVALDNLKKFFDTDIEPLLIGQLTVDSAIERHYRSIRRSGEVDDVLSGLDFVTEGEETIEHVDMRKVQELEDAPIVKLVNMMLVEAIQGRATDIHIESLEDKLSVRYRIDGVLQEMMSPPKSSQMGIVSRVKILARLNIAERRLPQDGRFTVKMPGGREIDVRTSIMPTVKGEKVVLRLLDKSSFTLDLTNLGFEQDMLKIFRKWIRRPYGIIIVSGPTGSGKSTTLYASLNEIKSVDDNITTVEDPVEYQLDRINQVQVNSDIGLTFATVLRSVLRQDPDKLLIGEIRDHETADTAIKFSLTGHLVFTTLHANDAPSTITRMLDIGVPHFLVASSLNLVMAQRLVRTICENCKEEYIPHREEWVMLNLDPDKYQDRHLYRARGCVKCLNTGFFGRTGIFEILEVSEPIRRLIYNKATQDDIYLKAQEQGMLTLRRNGIRKVLAGLTTPQEVVKTTIEEEKVIT